MIRRHLTYANVAATVSLALVLTGGAAYAANTIFSSDIVDGQVKTADIANDTTNAAIKGQDVAANTLGGSDINETTLAGQMIPGVTDAREVHSTGRIGLSAPDGGSPVTIPLFDNGTFTLEGSCIDTGVKTAQITISRASGSYSVASTDGLNLTTTSGQNTVVNLAAPAESSTQTSGTFSAAAPNGEALQGIFHVVGNAQGSDCIFAVSGLGF